MIRRLPGTTGLMALVLLLPCLAVTPDTLHLPENLSGVLSAESGICVLEGRSEVPAGSDLLIRPGSRIICRPGSRLDISGSLRAEGTPDRPVIFTGTAGSAAGSWQGIRIEGSSAAARFTHTLVYGAETGISCVDAEKVTIRDCGFVSCRQAGVFCEGAGLPVVDRSVFTGGDYGIVFFNCPAGGLLTGSTVSHARLAGVYCFAGSSPVIRDNMITACTGTGLRIAGGSSPQVTGNLISGNATGISCEGSGPRLEKNAVHHNRHYGILSHRSTPVIRYNNIFAQGLAEIKAVGTVPVDARFNWWGTNVLAADSPEDAAAFRHLVRRRFLGSVRVSNFLVSPYLVRTAEPRLIASVDIEGSGAAAVSSMGKTVTVTVTGEDPSPFAQDVMSVEIRHLALADRSVRLMLTETGPSSGTFRARVPVTAALWGNRRVPGTVEAPVVTFTAGSETAQLVLEKRRPLAEAFAVIPASGTSDSRLRHEDAVRFEWQYADPDFFPEPQRAWDLEIATSLSFATSAVVCRRQGAGTISHHILDRGVLETGISYFARLRVRDSRQWSGWVQTSFAINTPPPVPVPVFPAGGMELKNGLWPVLVAGAAEDPDGDPLSYQFELYRDSTCRELLDRGNGTHAQVYAAWRTGLRLEENGRYWWRVRAADGYETGPWSPVRSFAVNLVEEPLYPFALTAPSHASLAADEQITFRWEPAQDPDPGAGFTYTLWLADDPAFTNRIVVSGLRENVWKAPFPLANGTTWYWKVKAVGTDGNIAWCNTPALPHYMLTTYRQIIAAD